MDPAAIYPDYDSDPQRWNSWEARQDIHETVASELILLARYGGGIALLSDGIPFRCYSPPIFKQLGDPHHEPGLLKKPPG